MTRQIAFKAGLLAALIATIGCSHTPAQPSAIDNPLASVSRSPTLNAPEAAPKAANNSEQLVLSGTAIGAAGPVGFWIWCEVESNNPYADECNGSMYFYALGLTKHVEDQEGGVSETGEGQYQIKVESTKDDSVACTLQNTTALHGPQNTVTVDCTTPVFHAVSTTAVVNVTGPPSH